MGTLSKIEHLRLNSNKIKVISGLKSIVDSLKKLDLQNNPIEDYGDLMKYEITFKLNIT